MPRAQLDPDPRNGTRLQGAASLLPDCSLLIVSAQGAYGIYFFKPEHGAYGWAGADYGVAGRAFLRAIDYKTTRSVTAQVRPAC